MQQPVHQDTGTVVHSDVYDELKRIVQDPDGWLNQPNDQLGGQKPGDLLRNPHGEQQVRDLLEAIKHGMPT